jgi:CheY-like chemotaxis protein
MRKNTILWADDDPDDLQMMREILTRSDHHFDIVEVNNGKQALDYLHKAKENSVLPCLVILDINMPILDGKETLSIIRNTDKLNKIPVVVFTTSESELDKIYCRRLDAEMITKPPSFSSLESTVVRLLEFCNWRTE